MQVTRVAPDWPVPSLMHRRRVRADWITYVGLDVHKERIVVAVAAGGLRGEVREYGRIANTALHGLLRKLSGDGMRLRFCYETGPCGYGIQRRPRTVGLCLGHRPACDGDDRLIAQRLMIAAIHLRRQRAISTCDFRARLGRARGQENPRIHYLPDRRSDAGC